MKIFIRIIRVIFGIVLLAGFVYGLLTFAKAAPQSGDYREMIEDQRAGDVGRPADGTPASSGQTPGAATAPADGAEIVTPTVEPAPSPTPLPDTPAGRAAALGLPAPPQIDVSSWEFLLVNGDHSIDKYVPEQFGFLNQTISETDIQTSYSVNRSYDGAVDIRIAQPLLDMCSAAKAEGLSVYLTSCYRSYQLQAENFARVNANNGISDGKDAQGHYITMPAGCS